MTVRVDTRASVRSDLPSRVNIHARQAWLAILVLVTALSASSQTITASLEGTVHDPSGAVVAGAQVQISQIATNVTTRLTTDGTGRFLAPSLPPGPYSVTVEASGFKKAERSGITLDVAQAVRVDVRMELGSTTETVEVAAQPTLLESSSAAVGQVIDNKSIVNLPLNERLTYALVFLSPGVNGSVGDQYNNVNISINGGRPGSNAIMVDGVPSSTALTNPIQGYTVFPPVDAVQEFKVQTNSYSAEFGRSGGGVINMIYKSGTNDLHGSAFEFLRNSDLDANNFFANSRGIPLASFRRNQFGFSAGGPVYLPLLYNGRNKTFFFTDFEGLRQSSASNLNTTVPTALQRSGDFSQTRNAVGAPIVIYDPTTTVRAGTGYARTAFPGNVVPASRIDPVALNVVKYYPLPNGPGNLYTGANNYFVAGAATQNTNQYDVKVDENINERNRFFVRVSHHTWMTSPANYFPGEIAVAQGGVFLNDTFPNDALDYTFSASPTLLIEARYGFGRATENRVPRSNNFKATQLGLPAYLLQASGLMFPGFQAAGYTNLGNGGGSQWGPAGYNTHSTGVNVIKVYPAHLLKLGFDWRVMQANVSQGADVDGTFTFAKSFTQGPNPSAATSTAGDAMASMLLGTGGGQLSLARSVATQSEYYGWYVADDWKVAKRLTLNIGLRYALDLPFTERYNRASVFDPYARSPLAGPANPPNLAGGLEFANVNGLGRRLFATDFNGWEPRFGFAYQLGSGTVLRGGFGIFHSPSLRQATANTGTLGFTTTTPFVSAADGITPTNYLKNPFPGGLLPITGSSAGLSTGIGGPIGAQLAGDYKVPYSENWSFNIQRQLFKGLLVEVGYVGNRGVHLNESNGDYNLNQLTPAQVSLGNQLQQQVPNPFYGLIASGTLSTPTVPLSSLLSRYPQFTSVGLLYNTGSTSIYHAIQIKAEKRFDSGLSFLMSYNGQKLIDDYSIIAVVGAGAGIQNIYDRHADRSVSSNDVSQTLNFSFVYQLPFGKSKRFGAHWNHLKDGLLGGWQINGITTFQTGLPLVLVAQNTSASGSNTLRPNNNGKSAKLSGPAESNLGKYFNTSEFSQPAPFTFGNTGRTLPDVRTPGSANVDFSLFKSFRIVERVTLQMRAEAFNALNHVQFGRPDSNVSSATFGIISSQANTPRNLQFALKLLF